MTQALCDTYDPYYLWCEYHDDASCLFVGGTTQWICDPDEEPETGGTETTGNDDGNSGVAPDDPVSSATGELYTGTLDLDLGGPRPGLSFSRYYASLLASDEYVESALGTNWMHEFDLRLIRDGERATVVFRRSKIIKFLDNGSAWILADDEPIPFQLRRDGGRMLLMDPSSDLIYTFDSDGKLIEVRSRAGGVLTSGYSGDNLTQVEDGFGRSLQLSYSGDHLVQVEDQSGRTITFSYNGDNLSAVTDARGNTTTYDYTRAGGLGGLMTRATEPEGNRPYTQTFDNQGRVQTQSDSAGNSFSIAYDTPSTGMTRVTNPEDASIEHSHDSERRLTRHRDQEDRSIDLMYDSAGRRDACTDRLGDDTSITYHAPSGKVSTYADAEGNTTTNTYEAQEHMGFTFHPLTRVDLPDGAFTTRQYDNAGRPTTVVDQLGMAWSFEWDPAAGGRLARATNPRGGAIRFTYDPNDATLISMKDHYGNTTSYAYDEAKRLVSTTNPDGTTRSWAWDDNDNLLSFTDELERMTAFTYDRNNRQGSTTDPLGNTTSYTWDGNNRLIAVEDQRGKTWQTEYDEMGRLTLLTDPLGDTVAVGYDALGRLTSTTDQGGFVSSFSYDREGVPASFTNPLGKTWHFTSDRMGRVITVQTPLGATVDSAYDAMGRLSTITDGLQRTTTYGYDLRGELISITLADGTTTGFTRDDVGHVATITDPNGRQWQRNWGAGGLLFSETDPLGRTRSYTYDDRNRLTGIALPGGASSAMSFDDVGHLLHIAHSDGTQLSYAYTDIDKLESADGLTLGYDARGDMVTCNGIGIGRDAVGQITSLALEPGKVITYVYDGRGKVLEVRDWHGGVTTLSYDDAGRLVSIARPNGVITSITHDDDNRLIGITEAAATTLSSISLVRNQAGETTTATREVPLHPAIGAGAMTLSYDEAHRIEGASYDPLGRLTADGSRTYAWDLASRLLSYSEDGETTAFTYDGLGLITSRSDANGAQELVWNYALGMPVLSVVRRGSHRRYYVHLPSGSLLYFIESGERRYYHFDEVGTTQFLTDDSGSITDSYGVTPYGRVTARQGSTENPFVFGGAWGPMEEGGTGLYLMRARVYDARTQRFISRDPKPQNHPLTLSPYVYAAQNPLSFVDPMGADPEPPQVYTPELREAVRSGHIYQLQTRLLDISGYWRFPLSDWERLIREAQLIRRALGKLGVPGYGESCREAPRKFITPYLAPLTRWLRDAPGSATSCRPFRIQPDTEVRPCPSSSARGVYYLPQTPRERWEKFRQRTLRVGFSLHFGGGMTVVNPPALLLEPREDSDTGDPDYWGSGQCIQ